MTLWTGQSRTNGLAPATHPRLTGVEVLRARAPQPPVKAASKLVKAGTSSLSQNKNIFLARPLISTEKKFGPPPGNSCLWNRPSGISPFCGFLRLFADQISISDRPGPAQCSATDRQFVIGHLSFLIPQNGTFRDEPPRGQNETIGHQQLTPRKMVQYHFQLSLCSLRDLLFTLHKTEQNRTKREGGPKMERCVSTNYENQNRTSFSFLPRLASGSIINQQISEHNYQ